MKKTAAASLILATALFVHGSYAKKFGPDDDKRTAANASNRVYESIESLRSLSVKGGQISLVPSSRASAESFSSLHAADTADAREEEYFDRLYLSPEAVDKTCKYRSSIGTKPPLMRVALTFDDGPNNKETPFLLDILKKYNIRATFFMLGSSATANPEIVQRVADDGHLIIGNHSWSHPNFHTLTQAQQFSQIEKTVTALDEYQPQKYFRYPYGNSTCESNAMLKDHGYKVVGWHVDSCDWGYDNDALTVNEKYGNICGVAPKNRTHFVDHVVDSLRARKGGILLMHEVHGRTIRQIEPIIEQLIKDGFTFGSIDEDGFAPSMR